MIIFGRTGNCRPAAQKKPTIDEKTYWIAINTANIEG